VNDRFFDDFADVLERTSSYSGCITVGDINVHIDDVTDKRTAWELALLDSFGLIDLIRRPTHRYGHQLHVVISRADQTAPAIRIDPPFLSDPSLIAASISAFPRSTLLPCQFIVVDRNRST
jgi:hypothetical protein